MFSRRYFVRNLDADNLFESFIISAVSSILLIRLYLHLMNYPQIGGDGLHIAHMLWGGLFMLVAIFLYISYLTKPIQKLATIMAGVGFGTFIDELGKFITSDNNYFFQPTIALIYVIFILIYIFMQAVEKIRIANSTEYLMNAVELIKEVIINDLDINEKNKALMFLKLSNLKDSAVNNLETAFNQAKLISVPNPSIFLRVRTRLSTFYKDLIKRNWFIKLGLLLILINVLFAVVEAIFFIGSITNVIDFSMTFTERGEMFFSSLSVLMVIIGIFKYRRSKIEGLRFFKYSFLISVFLTEFFVFYRAQFGALIDLALDLLYLYTIEFMIDQESSNSQKIGRTV